MTQNSDSDAVRGLFAEATGAAEGNDRMPADSPQRPVRRPSPAELRSMLGANLRQLSQRAVSISALCRELGINRTQYNRYLAGESFPRPDVLHRICTYFEVDARILLEPVDSIVTHAEGPLQHPAISEFLSGLAKPVADEMLPNGFYRFARRSFLHQDKFVQGLIYVFRKDGVTFLKGFEAKAAIREQGLPISLATREFRGTVVPQDDGVMAIVSRRGIITASFNYLTRVPTFQNNLWVGYVARPMRENVAGRRMERLVYEFLGTRMRDALPVARLAGFCDGDGLVPYHRQVLKPDTPLT